MVSESTRLVVYQVLITVAYNSGLGSVVHVVVAVIAVVVVVVVVAVFRGRPFYAKSSYRAVYGKVGTEQWLFTI